MCGGGTFRFEVTLVWRLNTHAHITLATLDSYFRYSGFTLLPENDFQTLLFFTWFSLAKDTFPAGLE